MFEFILGYDNEAIALIVKDHETVKELFDKYEKAESRREKVKIAAKTIEELSIHAIIEEEIFYPTVRKHITEGIMNEADEEHHVARILVAELAIMDGGEDHYDAKYKVLSENIRHHIKEEEHNMLPKAKSLDLDFNALAAMMKTRKEELKRKGLPTSLEDRMVQATRTNDTPARESKRNTPKKPASTCMMEAKIRKTGTKATSANKKLKPNAGSKKQPIQPKLKIISARAANAAKTTRKPAAVVKAKTKNKR